MLICGFCEFPVPVGHDLKFKKTSLHQLAQEQAYELYEHFWVHWKKFHMVKHWFENEEILSYGNLLSIGAHSSHNFAGDHH